MTGTLGSGAMGHVYAAVDDVLGRAVAVKTLRAVATGVGARMLDERFRVEARAIAALNHPGIVQIYDIDLAAEPPYLVMERVAGTSLKQRFAAGPMAANELRALGIQIARALAVAHAAGILHRDVKPANILIAGPGIWKLADFGVAHLPDSALTVTGQFIGSPAYAPPEALMHGQSTAAGDVFGLGATLYYGAAGRWPYAEPREALLAPVPSLREFAPTLPDDLIATIDRAVAIEPSRRVTASELAEELAAATVGRSAAPPAPAIDTAFVPDLEPVGAIAARVMPAQPTAQTSITPDTMRWKLAGIGIAGITLVLVLVLAIAVAREPSAPPHADPGAAASAPGGAAVTQGAVIDAQSSEPQPSSRDGSSAGLSRTVVPLFNDPRAADEWRGMLDDFETGRFEAARETLVQWERRWGDTNETRLLRQHFDAFAGFERQLGPKLRDDLRDLVLIADVPSDPRDLDARTRAAIQILASVHSISSDE